MQNQGLVHHHLELHCGHQGPCSLAARELNRPSLAHHHLELHRVFDRHLSACLLAARESSRPSIVSWLANTAHRRARLESQLNDGLRLAAWRVRCRFLCQVRLSTLVPCPAGTKQLPAIGASSPHRALGAAAARRLWQTVGLAAGQHSSPALWCGGCGRSMLCHAAGDFQPHPERGTHVRSMMLPKTGPGNCRPHPEKGRGVRPCSAAWRRTPQDWDLQPATIRWSSSCFATRAALAELSGRHTRRDPDHDAKKKGPGPTRWQERANAHQPHSPTSSNRAGLGIAALA